mmetsp:Transcript_8879/g.29327  ORF Transcript_8879/g.29327 Transcript_8879/m.29327 type:complete len:83 (-) Transcript_8879:295-543(-)
MCSSMTWCTGRLSALALAFCSRKELLMKSSPAVNISGCELSWSTTYREPDRCCVIITNVSHVVCGRRRKFRLAQFVDLAGNL